MCTPLTKNFVSPFLESNPLTLTTLPSPHLETLLNPMDNTINELLVLLGLDRLISFPGAPAGGKEVCDSLLARRRRRRPRPQLLSPLPPRREHGFISNGSEEPSLGLTRVVVLVVVVVGRRREEVLLGRNHRLPVHPHLSWAKEE